VKKPPKFYSKLKWKVEDFDYEVLRRTHLRSKKSDSKAVREAVAEAVYLEVSNEFWNEYERMADRIKQMMLYQMQLVDKQHEDAEWEMRHLLIASGRLLENKEVQS
jgi:hypothetical protein